MADPGRSTLTNVSVGGSAGATIDELSVKIKLNPGQPNTQAQNATQGDLGVQQQHQEPLPVSLDMSLGPQPTAQAPAPPVILPNVTAPSNLTASAAGALPIPPVVPSNMTPKGRLMSSACRRVNTTNPPHTIILETPAHRRTAARNRSCIVCGVRFSKEAKAKSHFEGVCFDYYGNPNAHYWDDHPSFPFMR